MTKVGSAAEVHGFFTNRRGRRLYHALHGGPAEAPVTWVFCNALFEEKTFSQRAAVLLAREFANQGHAVLRFDYEGDGDSDGEVGSLRAGDRVADVIDAVAFMASHGGDRPVRLFSMRAGALVAAAAAAQLPSPPQRLLLWEPVLDGAAFVQECLRGNLTTQLSVHRRIVETREQLMGQLQAGATVNFSGYEVGAGLVDELHDWSLRDLLEQAGCPADLIHVARAEAKALPAPWSVCGSLPDVALHRCRAPAPWLQTAEYEDIPHALLAMSVALATQPHSDGLMTT